MSRAENLNLQSDTAASSVYYDDKRSASNEEIDSSPEDSIREQRDPKGDLQEKDEDVRAVNPNELEPVVSAVPSVNNVKSIPNGGLRAWLQVLGGFFLFFNSWGIVNTFGTYQTYYEVTLLTTSTPSAISWIGSLQAFFLMIVGAAAGPIYDRGYFRELLIGGSFLLVLGQMMLSLCTKYWQVLLAQGFCIGMGCGALFVPSVAILSTYFTTKIATVVGIAAAGSSIGGVLYPIIFHKLLPQIGFAWATRVLGFIMLATMLIPNIVMRMRTIPATRRSLLDLDAFKQASYSLTVLGFFIGMTGLYVPFFYAQVYAIEKHLVNENLGFYLLAVLNGASTFGRIIPNFIADKLGPFNVVIPCTLFSGMLSFLFIPLNSAAGLIVVMALYGFFSGCFVSVPPTIMVHLSLDARGKIGTRMGQMFAIVAVGLLIGTPIGGAILDRSGYTAIWIFGGAMILGGALILVGARVCHKGWGLMVKA